MSTPPTGPFNGDPNDPIVAAFLKVMEDQRRRTAAVHVINTFVRAKMPPWIAQHTLEELTKAINHIPPKHPRGRPPSLKLISGDDHDN